MKLEGKLVETKTGYGLVNNGNFINIEKELIDKLIDIVHITVKDSKNNDLYDFTGELWIKNLNNTGMAFYLVDDEQKHYGLNGVLNIHMGEWLQVYIITVKENLLEDEREDIK